VCDQKTGQCKCRVHVIGRSCDRCEDGFWNIDSKQGCMKCSCNSDGSQDSSCDIHSGECVCKKGVEGAHCDRCMSGYFGFSADGCKSEQLKKNDNNLNKLKLKLHLHMQNAVSVTVWQKFAIKKPVAVYVRH
jgi:Laminin EGF domain